MKIKLFGYVDDALNTVDAKIVKLQEKRKKQKMERDAEKFQNDLEYQARLLKLIDERNQTS